MLQKILLIYSFLKNIYKMKKIIVLLVVALFVPLLIILSSCNNNNNKTTDNKITTIHFYSAPTAQFIPMRKANHKELKLKGWEWQSKTRPKGKWDLDYKKEL